jgi:hypothetical protein
LDVVLPYPPKPSELTNYSFRPPAVKASTLQLAPEGWFSVQDYLSYRFEKIDPRFAGEGKVLETAEGVPPTEKSLSMRLLRYYKQGLLERKRDAHRFLYRLTPKGKRRGLLLEKRQESVYEHLPYARLARRPIGRAIPDGAYDHVPLKVPLQAELDAKPSSSHQPTEPPKCQKCGAGLSNRKTLICPRCHNIP